MNLFYNINNLKNIYIYLYNNYKFIYKYFYNIYLNNIFILLYKNINKIKFINKKNIFIYKKYIYNNKKKLYKEYNKKFLYESFKFNWYKYLITNQNYNLFIIYNNYIKYLYKYNLKTNLYLIKNLFFINNNLIHNYIFYKNNYNLYNNQINLYNIKNYFNLIYNNKIYNKIFNISYNYNNLSNIFLNDITTGLQSINIIFENKNIKNPISLISKNVFVIFYIKYYNYFDYIIYILNVCNKNNIFYHNYKLNFYSYLFEDISSIIYSGYSLNTNFYSINKNLKKYFNYLINSINIYQATKSTYIYIYNILLESILKQYNYQNIYLSSIYFELIIKKMLSCVKIISNDTILFKYNDKIPFYLINIINYSLNIHNYNIYKYEPIILGITKSIMANSGFLTNISFQNTFKVINLNILNNKIDWLVDIKSKIIMTDLLPIGNGWYRYLIN
uniref:DNA-directed RNA polymerase subunit C2 partB n=1 Tax=Leucocytozoon caulleryi TaxID=211597 RepID=U3TQI4_LEUCU|nr:DNA-directed RNA polymerase subunit C2 partB [Leucocytozoon caulleryi]BAN94689.1 DNA-directed RNA polymerase subunit C2 partB [Leucocytozoon caulleryi]